MPELDGLRGLAALSVVLCHMWQALPTDWHDTAPADWAYYPPLTFLLNDRGAVVLFFMLSGYVLAESLRRAGWPNDGAYVPFLIRRGIRIWLPFAAALIVSDMAAALTGPAWLAGVAPDQPLPGLLWMQLSLRYPLPPLDPPTWSLVVELLVAPLFPLLATAVSVAPWPTLLACLVLNMAMAPGDVRMFSFLLFFAAGAWLARRSDRIAQWCRALAPRWRWSGASLAVFALALPPEHFYADAAMGIGAVVAMVLALGDPAVGRVLRWRPLQALGRLSFSLYLTHVLAIRAIAAALDGVLPMPAILLVCVPAIAVATLVAYVAVERPAMRLGAMSADLFARRRASRAAL